MPRNNNVEVKMIEEEGVLCVLLEIDQRFFFFFLYRFGFDVFVDICMLFVAYY